MTRGRLFKNSIVKVPYLRPAVLQARRVIRYPFDAFEHAKNRLLAPKYALDARVVQQAVTQLFDQVIVVSLRRSVERRKYVEQHLASVGIDNFTYFDATDADDPAVTEAYNTGIVHRFPPCFRCGQRSCGSSTCLNILTPPQVATFLTYIRLMRRLGVDPHRRFLIVEDDVAFKPHASTIFQQIEALVHSGAIPFNGDEPALLRLTNPRRVGLDLVKQIELSDRPIMSNCCFALTRPMAAAIAANFQRIDTTADVFIHEHCASLGKMISIDPPIATDLSWSVGRFPSEIRPKAKHVEYLKAAGSLEEAARYRQAHLVPHVGHATARPIVITGHPRCGSAFAADACKQIGIRVGHERVERDGISSWMFAVDGNNPFSQNVLASQRRRVGWDYFILHTRDLRTAIPSVIREHDHAPRRGYDFLRDHIMRLKGVDLDLIENKAAKAAWSVILWIQIVLDQRPDFAFRIEDQAPQLADFLRSKGFAVRPSSVISNQRVNADKLYRGVFYPKPSLSLTDVWQSAPPDLRAAIAEYQQRFGYPLEGFT